MYIEFHLQSVDGVRMSISVFLGENEQEIDFDSAGRMVFFPRLKVDLNQQLHGRLLSEGKRSLFYSLGRKRKSIKSSRGRPITSLIPNR